MEFEVGSLTKEQIEAIFETLPVDITFVDESDEVAYFNKFEKRFFKRPKQVIGKKVHACHPQKSLHVVNEIVSDLKNGKRKFAQFWININDKLIYIRYFPVFEKENKYLGVLEVSQDITGIKKINGEKRLLD